jgi:hypothetical protein
MSSANILLDTSNAKTISTPSRLTVSNFVPIFGFTIAIEIEARAKHNTQTLRPGLNSDRFGLNLLSNVLLINLF